MNKKGGLTLIKKLIGERLYVEVYIRLAWEPTSAKVTKSYSHCLLALERFYREIKFSL